MTTKTEITLPEIPADIVMVDRAGMRNYARAAVEADRQRRGEPVAEVPEGWREQFKEIVYDNLAAADNQDVPLEEYPDRILEVLDSVVCPRHPAVVLWRNDAIKTCMSIAYKYCLDPETYRYLKQDFEALITEAPQPAEPCVAPTLHNADSGAQNGFQATQPAESVKVPSDDDLIELVAGRNLMLGCDPEEWLECVHIVLSRYGSSQPATSEALLDLVSRLRALSRYQHDDMSVADEAADALSARNGS